MSKVTIKTSLRKGKQHPLHAEVLDQMADSLESWSVCNFPLYRDDIVKLFRKAAKNVRKIVR